MNNSLGKAYLVLALLTVLSKNNYSQSSSQPIDSVTSPNKNGESRKTKGQVHCIRKLPIPVKKAFYNSRYRSWFIEKIITYNSAGKTFYKFILNNGNLLDGDHHDRFLQRKSLNITNSGIIAQE